MFGEQTLRPVKNGLYVHRNRRLIRDRTAASTFHTGPELCHYEMMLIMWSLMSSDVGLTY